jgi:hypothetical protein
MTRLDGKGKSQAMDEDAAYLSVEQLEGRLEVREKVFATASMSTDDVSDLISCYQPFLRAPFRLICLHRLAVPSQQSRQL